MPSREPRLQCCSGVSKTTGKRSRQAIRMRFSCPFLVVDLCTFMEVTSINTTPKTVGAAIDVSDISKSFSLMCHKQTFTNTTGVGTTWATQFGAPIAVLQRFISIFQGLCVLMFCLATLLETQIDGVRNMMGSITGCRWFKVSWRDFSFNAHVCVYCMHSFMHVCMYGCMYILMRFVTCEWWLLGFW